MDDHCKVTRLTDIGFRKAGTWRCMSEGLTFEVLTEFSGKKNVLYALVLKDEVKYVGKSIRTLAQRMQNYKTPGGSQRTNVKVRQKILDLGESQQIEIYVLPDNGHLHYGEFHLNLAAGLEDSLIKKLDPEWNGGKKTIEAIEPEVPAE